MSADAADADAAAERRLNHSIPRTYFVRGIQLQVTWSLSLFGWWRICASPVYFHQVVFTSPRNLGGGLYKYWVSYRPVFKFYGVPYPFILGGGAIVPTLVGPCIISWWCFYAHFSLGGGAVVPARYIRGVPCAPYPVFSWMSGDGAFCANPHAA